jgi:hypothetical protein
MLKFNIIYVMNIKLWQIIKNYFRLELAHSITIIFNFFLIGSAFGKNVCAETCSLSNSVLSIEEPIDLIKCSKIYADKSWSLSLDDVRAMQKNCELGSLADFEYAGKFEKGTYQYWVHFSIDNAINDTMMRILHLGDFDSITVWQFVDEAMVDEFVYLQHNHFLELKND